MTRIVAHRGDCWTCPENTLEAFAAAIRAGADCVELDVRVSADGVPVVVHDATLLRCWGVAQAVADLTWAELETLDQAGARIPSLAQSLALFAGTGVKVMVDLPNPTVVPAALAAVAAAPEVAVEWCGRTEALRRVREADPTAELLIDPDGEGTATITELHPRWINVDASQLTLADIERYHEAGLQLSVWTVDHPGALRALVAAGVDSITTNRIDLLAGVLDEPASPGPATSDPELGRYRAVALGLAEWAARTARSAADFTVETKADPADLVTDIDRRIERRVAAVLGAHFPDHALVGEEYGGQPGDGPTWYCDPIDGTTNFANGVGWYSFSLCLVVAGRPVVAVVADPSRDEIFDAVAGAGARCNGDPLPTISSRRLAGSVVLTELAGSVPWSGLDRLLRETADRRATLRIMGSGTLALVQVAAGRAAAALIDRFSPIDHGAGVLLAAEAGCRVLTSGGTPDLMPVGAPVLVAAGAAADPLVPLLPEPAAALE